MWPCIVGGSSAALQPSELFWTPHAALLEGGCRWKVCADMADPCKALAGPNAVTVSAGSQCWPAVAGPCKAAAGPLFRDTACYTD